MYQKPQTCIGCPLAGDMQGFVPDELVSGATTMILGQAPGQVEEREGRPFIGPTGEQQTEHFFPLAGLDRGQNVHIANVLKCRWAKDGHKTDELPPLDVLTEAVDHCTKAHLRIPEGTKLIIAEGGLAASWCADRPVPVHRWRGHLLYPIRPELPPVYVVEHLASVARDPKMWWVAELDWRKITRLDSWFQPIPGRLIASPNNWGQVMEWFVEAGRTAQKLAIDTEYIGRPFGPEQPLLTIIGLAYRTQQEEVKGLQLDCRSAENWMRASFYRHLQELVSLCPVVFQNYAADMPVLKRCTGVQFESYKHVDDTMLAHAILYCELPHTLEFLTSIYGMYTKLKHLGDIPNDIKLASIEWLYNNNLLQKLEGETPELLYNWGDVIETLTIDTYLTKGFETDQLAYEIYTDQSLALIPILLQRMERGLKVSKPRVMAAKVEYENKVVSASRLAEAYYGRPINLGSDTQLAYYCYQEKGYPVQYEQKTKRPTVDENAIAFLRDFVGPTVDARAVLTLDLALKRIEQGADPILEARVLYQEAQHHLDTYIYSLVKDVYNEIQEGPKKKAREHAKKLGFTEDDVVDRVYPNFAIHSQKTGRWSTTDPPLAQLPSALRDIIIPDEGEVHIHWDWKGIELHFLEAHSGSRILRQAHRDGIDLHTWTLCKMFGYELPPNLKDPYGAPENQAWRDKYSLHASSDPRRTFAKSGRYEMVYGGQGNTAAEKAIRMGLPKHEVQAALSKLLTADIDYYKWRQVIERQVKATRIIRTFMGRPRRFLTVGRGIAVPPKVVREALDYPMQGGVSDVLNTTIIKLIEKYPFLSLAWTMHDAVYLACPTQLLTEEVITGVQAIATQPYTIEDTIKSFPIDFDIIHPPI